jgi:hypothetical protein
MFHWLGHRVGCCRRTVLADWDWWVVASFINQINISLLMITDAPSIEQL